MNPHDLDHTIIHHINGKAAELEDQLKSDVVAYYGQIQQAYFRIFRNFIEEVIDKSKRKEKTLSIVLRTPGGSAQTVERMVSVVRKHYKLVNFIVPDLAMSAGTIFCMSGDRIYMDYSSSLLVPSTRRSCCQTEVVLSPPWVISTRSKRLSVRNNCPRRTLCF